MGGQPQGQGVATADSSSDHDVGEDDGDVGTKMIVMIFVSGLVRKAWDWLE